MAYPAGVPLRDISFGTAVILEDGTALSMTVILEADRDLIWAPTGDPLIHRQRTFTGDEGEVRTIPLPVTDSPDYRTPQGDIIDVTGGKQSHSYHGRVTYFLDGVAIRRGTIGPFILPEGDGSVVDIDLLVPWVGPTGVLFSIPDQWSSLVQEARDAALEAAEAATGSDGSAARAEAAADQAEADAAIATAAAVAAGGSEDAAALSAQQAEASSASAESSALAAAQSRDDSQSYADQAQVSAGNASDSQAAAALSKDAAAASALAAAGSEQSVADDAAAAEAARAGAVVARTGAETAKTGAETAQTGAQAAQAAAEAARNTAMAQTFAGVALGTADLDTITTAGVYHQATASSATLASHYPFANITVTLEVRNVGATWREQRLTIINGGGRGGSGIYTRRFISGAWDTWTLIPKSTVVSPAGQPGVEISTWDDVNATNRQVEITGTSLVTVDLNNVTVPGTYQQGTNANATLARNYPEAAGAGILEVFRLFDSSVLVQRFTPHNGTAVGMRAFWIRRLAGGVWGGWQPFTATRSVQATGGALGAELFSYDVSGATDRQLEVINVSLGTADLNVVTLPGKYVQTTPANATLVRNYPAGAVGQAAGLEVIPVSSTLGNCQQRLTIHGGRGFYQRSIGGSGTSFGTWRYTPTQRTDKTAGIAVYTWDEVAGREQLIYGDTGWRDISALLNTGWTAAAALIRRTTYDIDVRLINLVAGSGATTDVFTLPAGWRGNLALGNARLPFWATAVAATGPATAAGNLVAPSAINGTIAGKYSTVDAWPTSLPGAIGSAVPNL